jgi:hypothetical protein
MRGLCLKFGTEHVGLGPVFRRDDCLKSRDNSGKTLDDY